METNSNEILKPIYLAEMSFDDGDFELHQSLLLDEFKFKSPFGNFDNVVDYMNWLKTFYDFVNQQGGTRHLIMNPVVNNTTKDTVLVNAYLVIINRKTMQIMGTSVIHDTLKLTNEGWKFTDRVVATDQTMGQ